MISCHVSLSLSPGGLAVISSQLQIGRSVNHSNLRLKAEVERRQNEPHAFDVTGLGMAVPRYLSISSKSRVKASRSKFIPLPSNPRRTITILRDGTTTTY